jgi:hypothetical protein
MATPIQASQVVTSRLAGCDRLPRSTDAQARDHFRIIEAALPDAKTSFEAVAQCRVDVTDRARPPDVV